MKAFFTALSRGEVTNRARAGADGGGRAGALSMPAPMAKESAGPANASAGASQLGAATGEAVAGFNLGKHVLEERWAGM